MLILIFPLVFTLLALPIFKNLSWIYSTISFFVLSNICLLFFQPRNLLFNIKHNFLIIDALSIPIILLTLWVSLLIILSRYKILNKKISPKLFICLIISLAIILMITFIRTNLIIFYICFEASMIPTLFLILSWGAQPERLQASSYFILYTVTASLPLLLSLIIIFKTNRSLFIILNFWVAPTNQSILSFWWLITITAFLVKIPIYTVHLWLPKAHVEAPVAGSIILAAILLKLGRYGIIRISLVFPFINLNLLTPITIISLLGTIISRIICIRQQDIKALIAYASIRHIGLLIAAIISSSFWGWQGTLAIIIAHGICRSAIFSRINIIYEISASRRLYIIKGIITIIPRYSTWLFLIIIANIATPPSINLITEIILITAISALSLKLILLLILSAFLSAAYSLYLFSSTQHGIFPNHLKPINFFSNRNILILLLHTFPLFLLNLRIDIILQWL